MNFQACLDNQPLKVLEATVYPAPYNERKRTEYVICHGNGGQTLRIRSAVAVKSAIIRPLSLGLKAEMDGEELVIHLAKPANFSLELNGSYEESLLVFYAPAREESVRPDDERVIYFAPGEHTPGIMDISEDNTTVYLAEGAYVHGKLAVHDCAGFTLCGRGVLTEESYSDLTNTYIHCVNLVSCRDVEIRDVTLTHSVRWTCRLFGCDNVHIDNLKIIGCRGNNDGIDICGSRNVLVENCFTRTWDDSLVIKAFDSGDLENVTCRACTLWNDFARPIEVGVELRADHVRNVVFDDIDIIHSPTGYPVMGIHHGDRALVTGIVFKNIRIEDVPGAQMFDIRVTNSVWNKDDTMGRIDGIHFENIELVGKPGIEYLPEMSRLQGYSDECDIRNVTFKNIRFLGKAVRSAEEMGLLVMDYVRNVRFESDAACEALGHASVTVETTDFEAAQDGLQRGTVRALVKNSSDVPVNAAVWLVVSPVNTAEYPQEKRALSLKPGEETSFEWPVVLPAGRYVMRVQSDDAAVEPGWTMKTLELKLGETPVSYPFVNYYGDRLARAALSVKDGRLYVESDALFRTDASMTVYSAMPAEEYEGEVKFTVEETDFGEAPAVLMGRHGLELAPQLRCPAEITYVFKNEPRVKEIRKNVISPNASGSGSLSFEEMGLEENARAFWLELEIKLPETAKYRYPYTLFHSVKPGEIAHMFAHVVLD